MSISNTLQYEKAKNIQGFIIYFRNVDCYGLVDYFQKIHLSINGFALVINLEICSI